MFRLVKRGGDEMFGLYRMYVKLWEDENMWIFN